MCDVIIDLMISYIEDSKSVNLRHQDNSMIMNSYECQFLKCISMLRYVVCVIDGMVRSLKIVMGKSHEVNVGVFAMRFDLIFNLKVIRTKQKI